MKSILLPLLSVFVLGVAHADNERIRSGNALQRLKLDGVGSVTSPN